MNAAAGLRSESSHVIPRLDHPLDDAVLDASEDHVLEVAELVLDPLPEPADAVRGERLEDVDGLLHLVDGGTRRRS